MLDYEVVMHEFVMFKEDKTRLNERLNDMPDGDLVKELEVYRSQSELVRLSEKIRASKVLYRMYSLYSWMNAGESFWSKAEKNDSNEKYGIYWCLHSIIESGDSYAFGRMLVKQEAREMLQTKYETGSLLDMAKEKPCFHAELIKWNLVEYRILKEGEKVQEERKDQKGIDLHIRFDYEAFFQNVQIKTKAAIEYLKTVEYRNNLDYFLNTTVKEFLDDKFKDQESIKKSAISIPLFTATCYVISGCSPIKSTITGALLFGGIYMLHKKFCKDNEQSQSAAKE